ncbi:MAG: hypothetical protein AMJ95_03260 [Omnitrophica WOR_2 bacterium SM23_72]|nr:MAG: hypothetical protein AMJ95_03260 [Omnitrophica WOR_2 bacterium SM23_72]
MAEQWLILKLVFQDGWENLLQLKFFFFNPLFWCIIFLLFIVLHRLWVTRHAFSFSIMTALILLFMTEIDNRFSILFAKSGEIFDPSPIRLVAFASLTVIFLVYTFIR